MNKLFELEERKNKILNEGKARERINLLFDEGSFIETDMFMGKDIEDSLEGVITGYGTVDGRLTFAYAQNSSAFSIGQAKKICKVIDMALKTGAPIVSLIDSIGAKLIDGIDSLTAFGKIYKRGIKTSGSILQISAIFGTCAGGASFIPNMSDIVVMTKGSSLMVNGPLVCSSEGHAVTVEEMASADINAAESGIADFVEESDALAIERIKSLIKLLPSNAEEYAPESDCADDLNRIAENLNADDIKAIDIIKSVADNADFMEMTALYATNMITGLAKINGRTVAVLANNGELEKKALNKASSFIRFADCFNLPILTLADSKEFEASKEAEKEGLSKEATKLLAAYLGADVPKVTVITKNACTSAGLVMGSKGAGADFVLAFANATIGALTPDMASVLLLKDKVAEIGRDAAKAYYEDEIANAFEAAKAGLVDDVIEPDTLRPRVAAALEMLYTKGDAPPKKHINISL